jgi:small subunit ribosomal protein S1
MKDLIEKSGVSLVPLKIGSTYEVEIISKTRNRVLVNVNNLCLGIIPEKELSAEVVDLKPHDKILAYLIDLENDEGYAVLSLKRADRERVWQMLKDKMEKGESVKVKVVDANRGGLIVQYGSIEGFLPISHLAQKYTIAPNESYKVIKALRESIDKIIEVKIINLDQANNKLIFSEKEISQAHQKEKIKKLFQIGAKVDGKITAIVPFGLFVDLGEVEGLVHISEISWQHVNDLNKMYKVGDAIQTEVIDTQNGKISLSIKRLLPDPWVKAVEDFKEGDEVDGTVTRITPFGAFVELNKDVTGLVHISELAEGEKANQAVHIEEILALGKKCKFKIKKIEKDSHKISLTPIETNKTNTKKKSSSKEKSKK